MNTPPRRGKGRGEEDSIVIDYAEQNKHGKRANYSSGKKNGDSSGRANGHIQRVESIITFNQVDDFNKQSRQNSHQMTGGGFKFNANSSYNLSEAHELLKKPKRGKAGVSPSAKYGFSLELPENGGEDGSDRGAGGTKRSNANHYEKNGKASKQTSIVPSQQQQSSRRRFRNAKDRASWLHQANQHELKRDGRTADEIAYERVLKKAYKKKLQGDKELMEQNDPHRRYEVFKKMPKHMRIEVIEDIKISIAQNTENELSKIPPLWKKNLNNDVRSLKLMQYYIEQDVEKMKPSNIQGSSIVVPNDNKNNNLSRFKSEHPDGPECLMWWPPTRQLIPVKSLQIYGINAKYLECKFFRPDQLEKEVSTAFDMFQRAPEKVSDANRLKDFEIRQDQRRYKKEHYSLLELYKLQDQENALKGQGMTYSLGASDYLRALGCDDYRVGKFNVLKLCHTAQKFERIFVFYNTDVQQLHQTKDSSGAIDPRKQDLNNIIIAEIVQAGTEQLRFFMDAIKLLLEKLGQKATELQGHMAELVEIKKPEYKDNFSDNSNDSNNQKKQKLKELQRQNLEGLYLTELHDVYLQQLQDNLIQLNKQDMEDENNEIDNDPNGALTAQEKMQKKLDDMKNKQVDEEKIDRFLIEQINLSDANRKRDDQNNILLRFTNFLKSVALKINFKELDKIRDEQILGIETKELLESHEYCRQQAQLNNQDFTNNMVEFWGQVGKQLKITDQTMKITDMKMIKMYFCERMLPEYNSIALQNTIDRIMEQLYYEKLKQGATKHFMKWVDKQVHEKSKLQNDIKQMSIELKQLDEEIRKIQHQQNTGQHLNISQQKYSKRMTRVFSLPQHFEEAPIVHKDDTQNMSQSDNTKKSRMQSTKNKASHKCEVIDRSFLLLMRGTPEMQYGNNFNKNEYKLQLKRYVSEGKLRNDQQLRDQLKKDQQALNERLQEKETQFIHVNQEINFLQVKIKMLTDIQNQVHIIKHGPHSSKHHKEKYSLSNELLERFSSMPIIYQDLSFQDKIKLFKQNQKMKLEIGNICKRNQQQELDYQQVKNFIKHKHHVKHKSERCSTRPSNRISKISASNNSNADIMSRYPSKMKLLEDSDGSNDGQQCNDLNHKHHKAKAIQYHDQEYTSFQEYPLTQIFDELAEQELELKLQYYNYDGSVSRSQHEKVKERRGGKKKAKAKQKKEMKSKVAIYNAKHPQEPIEQLEQDPNYQPEETWRPKDELVAEIAKLNGMTDEEVLNIQDNQEEYNPKDPFGNDVNWIDFEIILDHFGQFQKIENDHTDKNYKTGSAENFDMDYRDQLEAKIDKTYAKLEKDKRDYDKTLKRHQSKHLKGNDWKVDSEEEEDQDFMKIEFVNHQEFNQTNNTNGGGDTKRVMAYQKDLSKKLNAYYNEYQKELEQEYQEELKDQEALAKQKEKKNSKADVISMRSKYLDNESNRSSASRRQRTKKGETPGGEDISDEEDKERNSRRTVSSRTGKARKSIKQDDYETPGDGPTLKETDEGYEMTRGQTRGDCEGCVMF